MEYGIFITERMQPMASKSKSIIGGMTVTAEQYASAAPHFARSDEQILDNLDYLKAL